MLPYQYTYYTGVTYNFQLSYEFLPLDTEPRVCNDGTPTKKFPMRSASRNIGIATPGNKDWETRMDGFEGFSSQQISSEKNTLKRKRLSGEITT